MMQLPAPVRAARARAEQVHESVNERLPPWLAVGLFTLRVRSERAEPALDRVARFRRTWNAWHTLGVVLALLLLPLVIWLFVDVAQFNVQEHPAPSPANNPKNAVLVPGVNDAIPLFVAPIVVAALLVSAAVHELGHGIAARVADIDVDEVGVLLLGGVLPLAAYVKVDQDVIGEASTLHQLRIYAAGILNNVALAVVSVPLMLSSRTDPVGEIGAAYRDALMSGGTDLAGIAAIDPVSNFVFWILFLNVNLAMVNVLPLAVLDGGHIVRALVDGFVKVTGRTPATNSWRRVSTISVMVLSVATFALMVVALFGPQLPFV